MSDLDASIRAKLAEFTSDYLLVGEHGSNPGPGHDEMKAALLAALDRHEPIEGDRRKPVVCGCTLEPDDPYTAWEYPCPTVKAIAKAFGIGVGDD